MLLESLRQQIGRECRISLLLRGDNLIEIIITSRLSCYAFTKDYTYRREFTLDELESTAETALYSAIRKHFEIWLCKKSCPDIDFPKTEGNKKQGEISL